MKLIHVSLALMMFAFMTSGCDCDGTTNPCDCEPVITFTQPGSTVLTEFHDTRPGEVGIQYPVSIRTTCVPENTTLTYENDAFDGEVVTMQVVIDDDDSQIGRIDFSDQSFAEGSNRICIRGGVTVDREAGGEIGSYLTARLDEANPSR